MGADNFQASRRIGRCGRPKMSSDEDDRALVHSLNKMSTAMAKALKSDLAKAGVNASVRTIQYRLN